MADRSHPDLIPDVQKIAVLRANALGDFIFALPALTALRETYPQAEIVLLAREWHQRFLSHRPGPVDRVIVIPQGGIGNEFAEKQDPQALAQFFTAMQAEKFDLAIQLHGGGRNSNPFTLNLGAKLTIGLRTPDAVELDRWVPYLYYQSEIMRYLEVVRLVGATTAAILPQLAVTQADLAEAESVITTLEPGPFVVLHPGASDPRRCWPPEKFAAVGDALADLGLQVLVTGTESERERVDAVLQHMGAKAYNLCGHLSLNGLTGLLSRCSLLIANDTGPLHVAAAVGTTTIGIYWCGNLITAGPLERSQHRPMISWRLQCPVCGVDCTRDRCDHQESFVADIPIREVIAAARDLVSRSDTMLLSLIDMG